MAVQHTTEWCTATESQYIFGARIKATPSINKANILYTLQNYKHNYTVASMKKKMYKHITH